ncbi:MAG TPA: hypothetical protein PLD53_09100 [Candidatus Propionivibrio aalborgensis]|nr:hypothetical protein [Candidatus Propionivibrio aalborgensis]
MTRPAPADAHPAVFAGIVAFCEHEEYFALSGNDEGGHTRRDSCLANVLHA